MIIGSAIPPGPPGPAGTPVRCEMTKWGDRPHWRFDGRYLGEDTYGRWIGFPAGTHSERPGFAFDSEVDSVRLVPTHGWFMATFHAPGIWCSLYTDISTPPTWDGNVLRAVDLDLDVITMSSGPAHGSLSAPQNLSVGPGETFVDDEDEFADNQIAHGYPQDVIEAARTSCDQVLAAVRQRRAPFDDTHERWLWRLTQISRA